MRGSRGVTANGAVAGVLAATAFAVWFFVVDLVMGRPFMTPAFLAGVLTGTAPGQVGAGLIAVFTIFHYAVFTAIGIGTAHLIERIRIPSDMLIGLVIGFLLFNLMFYGSLIVSGENVLGALGWPSVLVANLLAGLVLTAWLHLRGVGHGVTWFASLSRNPRIREGAVAGLIGAGAVAVWFLVFDAVLREPLYTPAALGSAIFLGARSPAEIQITATTVIGYTVIHVVAFLVVGLIASSFLTRAEKTPPLLFGMLLFFVALQVFVIGAFALLATWILNTLGWWAVAIGNVIAAVAVFGYLWSRHAALRRIVRSGRPIEDEAL